MPIKRSAYKELRKSKKRHARNISAESELNTLTKDYLRLIVAKKSDDAKSALGHLISKIDKAAKNGVIKHNTAARHIARLMKRLSQGQK